MSKISKHTEKNLLLPSFNYKHFTSLVILLLVTSITTQSPSARYVCPNDCECDESTFSAKCDNVEALIACYSRKHHQDRHNFMPIQSLDLSNNQLNKVTNKLELLTNLTKLNLSHNQLTQVQKLNFPHLETLDLSYNRITSAKLKKLPKNVVNLNLTSNEITYLPVDFVKLKKLRSLELAGNPLNCTCHTLLVRNWITFNHVWSDKHIVCSSPSFVKGMSWLQARQNDICMETSTTTTQRSKYNWDNYEDDNDIMMGDQPQTDDADDIVYDDEEEENEERKEKSEDEQTADEDMQRDEDNGESTDIFEDTSKKPEDTETGEEDDNSPADDDDFMPVSTEADHKSSTVEPKIDGKPESDLENYDEGSGFENSVLPTVGTDEDSDESGSGGIPIINPQKDDLESSTEEDDLTVAPLGIFEDNTEAPIGAQRDVLTAEKPAPIDGNLTPNDVNKASQESDTGTYILLAILALCLIALMIFVAMKNRQEKNRNRCYDVEKNGATELQDMDKRLLGKPLDRNGNGKAENAPLMNDYPNEPLRKEDRPAYTTFQPPAITVEEPKAAPREKEKSQQSLYENKPNGTGLVESVHRNPSNGSIPRLPDSDDETFHPADDGATRPESLNVSPEPAKRYSPVYTSASPRSDRYSPVYSPETGRVKIKLTETPKPKTPVVVTRSRSRAGEYINTPN